MNKTEIKNRSNVNTQRFIILSLLIIVLTIIPLASATYTVANNYNPLGSFIGGWAGSNPGQFDTSMCQAGQDFVVQIAPFGCTPAVVRSDLLEEQNVPVFCQLSATQINPLVNVNYINQISITGQYPSSVSTVGFHPAQAALQPASGNINSPVLNNLGYAAIVLRQQEDESAMPDYIEGNLTVKIRYDLQNAFGVGKSTFYLPLISDETDWQSKYTSYGFWNGRGFLRADAIDIDSASISLYAGSSPYDSGDVQRQSTVSLKKGETSGEIPVHGFDFCYANLKLKLDDLVNPDTRAQIKVNGDLIEVTQGETFLDGKCQITGIEKIGVGERVGLRCQEDGKTGLFSSTTPFALSRNPRINISINGDEKDAGIGDYLYESKDEGGKIGYVYVGYIGSSTGSSDMKDLFMYLVNADYKKEKLDNGDIEMATRLSDYYTSGSSTGVITIDFFKNGISGALRLSQQTLSNIFSANKYYLFNFKDIESKALVYGASIKINNFANPLDAALDSQTKQYYDDANADYEQIINSYSKETYNNVKLGEQAFIQEIELANSLGQKRTMLDLCQKFKEQYPSSGYYATSDCNNGLRLSSSASSSKSVVINGKTKIISLGGIYNPSFDDFGARVKIEWDEKDSAGNAVHKTDTYDLTKDKVITFGSNNENIQLSDIDDDTTADFIINVPSGSSTTGIIDTLTSNRESFELGITEAVRAYKFTMLNLNIKKVAKVSVLPNIDYAETEATFPFKIGIEKRGIKLSPEKTQERISSLNSTIEKWDKISNNLGKVVQGLKTACLATEGLFTVQNFFANLGGEGIARTKVMRDAGGWYDQCDELVRKGDYSSQHDCLSSNSEAIDSQVNDYLQIINAQDAQFESLQEGITTSNGLFSSDAVDADKLIERYSPRVESALASFGNIADANGQNPISIEDLKAEISYNTWKSQKNYGLNDLRELEFYANAVKKNPNDKAAKARLYSIASEIHANSEGAVEAQNLANTLKIDQNKIGFLEIGKTRSFPYTGIIYSDIKSGIFISGIADNEPVAVVQTNLAEKYIVVLDGSGSEKQLPVKRVDGNFQVYNVNTKALVDASALPDELKGGVVFEKFDSSTYSNKYTNPEVRYYETAPYKGYPSIVPFDTDKGWYAGIRQTLPILGNIGSYDNSGRAASFYLCNVGADGKESFLSGGDDTCQMINLAQRQTFNQFYGLSTSETNSLVDKAVNAIESAQRAYKDGVDKVTIGGKSYDVGNPASDAPEMQCEDFMSPTQCQILFNVCDPVICPSSRCDLGGQYPVRDVVQSGIVGSIALCLPNAREGIVMPVCLTGVQAGVDSWNSVLTSYRDCLQENLDTGKTTGICDEINSVYTCEFFWKQGLPIAQAALPKIISSVLGQNTRGGGEYLSVQNAWSNAEKSVDYFTQYYAANSFAAFKARSLEEAGTPICRSYVSAVYPSGGNLLNTLTQPDSPPQFTGRFDEIPFTTQTNPPTSQYKVFYHIYAGKDSGAYYSVYLKGVPGSSYYQDTSINRIVASGYIASGDYNTDTLDFTASSGYSQMCISVNGQEACGFKEVSTDFALNYVNEQYLSEQASKTDITSESSCISGDASVYSFLNPNVESAANSLIDPKLYNSGITRICATNNPGKGTDNLYGQEGQRWIEVGYCGDTSIKCWVDTQSVKDSIKITGIENQTLQDLTEEQLQLMQGSDYSKQFAEAVKKINDEKDNYNNKVEIITSLITTKKFFFNQQVAYLLFLRGNAISEIAKSLYKPVNDATTIKQQDELGASEGEKTLDQTITQQTNEISNIGKTNYPIFQFQSGGVIGLFKSSVYYSYSGDSWYWSVDNEKWFAASIAAFAGSQAGQGSTSVQTVPQLSQDIKELTLKLPDKTFDAGMWELLIATEENVGKGTVSNVELSSGYVRLSPERIFTFVKTTGLRSYFEYDTGSLKWKWSGGSGEWFFVPEVPAKYSNVESEVKTIVKGLENRDYLYGAQVIFGLTPISTDYDGEGTLPSSGQFCEKVEVPSSISKLNDAEQRVLSAAVLLDKTSALSNAVIGDYDKSGGVNCFDSTVYVYRKAGANYQCVYSDKLGKKYNLADGKSVTMDNKIFFINEGKCGFVGLGENEKLDKLQPGDMLSIVYSPTSGHNVIFIEWTDKTNHIARIFDWINKDSNGNKIFGYRTMDLSDDTHAVYMFWKPVISGSFSSTAGAGSGLSCTTQESCQKALGAEIIKIAKQVKQEYEIDDETIKEETGAKNFECLVLQQSLEESGIQHCASIKDASGDPLYCNGNLDSLLKKIPEENNYGIMQLNIDTSQSVAAKDFTGSVRYASGYFVLRYLLDPKEYLCNGKSYSGWKAALRFSAGWIESANACSSLSSSNINYVENVLNKKDAVADLFPECR